ncbi:hypothetical protein HO173_010364 [Letharia columbiana]|uniref:F-box domain-containing protein n=1 Tax=Letharia columbiana TaxID=112416 RepID=A0A8H6L0W4_9LECA|nr:uncharacterized protein HO173_010364 [Letharia columbiana]KAF6231404.1 hypothetical protein HO173_010364 [Letharia columbiana]
MDAQLLLPPVSPVPPNPFLSLTIELKQIIFSALPDTRSLISLILTCSSFYHTFLDAESLIIKSILRSQVGLDLIFDATIVFKSTTLKAYSNDAAIELLKSYTKQDFACLSQIWKLRDALAVGGLHDNIEFFSRDFASLALSIDPVTGLDEASPSPLSLLESTRIKRTFYRYELFCNIFRKREDIQLGKAASESPQSIFFSICAPWENEQLACVRDYLFKRLSLPFNEVAEHDVEWGQLEMNYLDDQDELYDYWKEHYLSLGLTYLRQLVTTPAFDDRCRLLKEHKRGPACSLFDALEAQGYGNGLSMLENYTEEDEHVHITAQLAIDGDKGPEEAWRWAYAGNTNAAWYNISEQGSLRKRGYVMWDSARLAQWGLLTYEWDELSRDSFNSEDHRRRMDEMRGSFKARHEIWCRGGRGWWSAKDESRVVWPPPAPPERAKTMEPKRCWGNRDVWATDMETWRENL